MLSEAVDSGAGLSSPAPSQRFHGATPKLGAPVCDYLYRNAAGRDVLHVCRYQRKPDETAPQLEDGLVTRYWLWSASGKQWEMVKAAPKPAPLWQLDRLFAQPSLPVYIVDTEEAATELQSMLTEHDTEAIATTWAGGASGLKNIDLTALQDRSVWLWPTNNSTAQAIMLSLAAQLYPLLEKTGYEVGFIRPPTDKPAGWDITAAARDGWTWEDIQQFISLNVNVLAEAPQAIRIEAPRLTTSQKVEVIQQARHQIKNLIGGSMSTRWREYGFALATNGLPHNNLFNVVKVVEFHKGAYCDVWLDEFHNKIMTRETDVTNAREWNESDTLEFTRFIQDPAGVGLSKMGTGIVHEAVALCAAKNKRNEVREWLQSLHWDGTERLSSAFPRGWGTADTNYYQAIGRCFIMGAAARILQPGCQVDTLPVFEGPQGIFKSSAIMTLASEPWYDNPTYELGEHDFFQCLNGKWILEFAEMANLSGRRGDQMNSVITRRTDTYRPSYGRMTVTYPRMCVFAATVNDPEWNNSQFGARRFWPVACGKIDLGLIKEMREQWFAEAVARVERGEKWYDVPIKELKEAQSSRVPTDLWDSRIADYLMGCSDVTLAQIASGALELEVMHQTQLAKLRIIACLKKLGWEQFVGSDGRQAWRRVHEKPSTSPPALDDLPHGF